MNGESLTRGFFQLPGQSLAFYNGSGFNSIRHADWLGSSRLASAPDGTYLGSMAVAPLPMRFQIDLSAVSATRARTRPRP